MDFGSDIDSQIFIWRKVGEDWMVSTQMRTIKWSQYYHIKSELVLASRQVWSKVPVNYIQRLYKFIPKRIQSVKTILLSIKERKTN